MEEFLQNVWANLPEVAQWVMMALAYFIAFLANNKIGRTSTSLANSIKFTSSSAEKKIAELEKKVEKLETVIDILLEDETDA